MIVETLHLYSEITDIEIQVSRDYFMMRHVSSTGTTDISDSVEWFKDLAETLSVSDTPITVLLQEGIPVTNNKQAVEEVTTIIKKAYKLLTA